MLSIASKNVCIKRNFFIEICVSVVFLGVFWKSLLNLHDAEKLGLVALFVLAKYVADTSLFFIVRVC